MSQNETFIYIDSRDALLNLCLQLERADILALDTEFIREKTYHAQLCLIQIAADDIVACIDPLSIDDLSPLFAILNAPGKLKVLHAARQDYEIFHDLQKKLPCPVFDTQIAAGLLGYGDQIGYAALISQVLGVNLDKDHARTDWSLRPLSAQQLDYAANDVRYLLRAYHIIEQQLQQLGRSDWLTEDFTGLCEPSLYVTHPDEAWLRIKGSNKLKPRQLAALQLLAAWRENRAISNNKPRRWILSDDLLLKTAQLLPAEMQALQRIRGLPDNVIQKSGKELLNCIHQAQQLDKDKLPQQARHKIPDAEQVLLGDFLMTYLKIIAKKHNISPSTLASRKDIDQLASGNYDVSLMKGWKRKLVGEPLQKLLQGKITLTVEDNRVIETNQLDNNV